MKKNDRKITSQEISQLYQFTRKHYVEYYDVQTELVDHLATGMEERWQKQPALPFEENLRTEFKKFGIYGFSEVVEKRKRAMHKKYLKLIWGEMKAILKQPQFFLFGLTLLSTCIFLMGSEAGYNLLIIGLLILCPIQLLYIFRLYLLDRNRKKVQKKRYLLEDIILNVGSISVLFVLPLNIAGNLSYAELSDAPVWTFLLAFFISTITFLSYICLYQLPKKKNQILKKAYPELKFE